MGGTDPFTRVSVKAKPALYWPLLLKQSNVKWLAHTYKLRGSIAPSFKNETQPLSLLLFWSGDRIKSLMLIFTTNNRAICMSNSEQSHCQTLLAYRTHRTSTRGWTPPSQISPIIVQKRPTYENLSFHYVTKGLPVGAVFYQWLGCRDHAGLVCFPHSGSW